MDSQLQDSRVGGGADLANWIVRLNAKGEASRNRDDLRRVALVTAAKSAAEVQLFRQQRSRSLSGNASSGSKRGLKRLSSSSVMDSKGFPGVCVDCETCNICSTYQASGANSCYCKAIGIGHASAAAAALGDDEESRLIDEFLSSLDGVPSKKKCKL